jgi:hypothetical protein
MKNVTCHFSEATALIDSSLWCAHCEHSNEPSFTAVSSQKWKSKFSRLLQSQSLALAKCNCVLLLSVTQMCNWMWVWLKCVTNCGYWMWLKCVTECGYWMWLKCVTECFCWLWLKCVTDCGYWMWLKCVTKCGFCVLLKCVTNCEFDSNMFIPFGQNRLGIHSFRKILNIISSLHRSHFSWLHLLHGYLAGWSAMNAVECDSNV